MGNVTIQKRGKYYQYKFEIARVDGKRKFINKSGFETKDEAIRTVADYVYNVFKYHLVKYLGLFDVLYRYHVSKLKNIDMEKVAGLGLLLQKLEYNALSSVARKVSDFGVPFKLIDYYDSQQFDKGKFDDYERYVDDQIRKLLQ